MRRKDVEMSMLSEGGNEEGRRMKEKEGQKWEERDRR